MPCDIGFKNAAQIRVEPKLPNIFKEKTQAPSIDQSLLDSMGVSDAIFLEWVSGLETTPLLNEALSRVLRSVADMGATQFRIVNGELEISSTYNNAQEKKMLEKIAKKVSERFQMEVLGIVAQLLDYRFVISEDTASETLVLEGEKEENADVHKYLKISISSRGEGVFVFEHFESPSVLKEEQARFLALARKLGIRIHMSNEQQSGQPIPAGVEHHHFLPEGA